MARTHQHSAGAPDDPSPGDFLAHLESAELPPLGNARATVVNRTHRVVRKRAEQMQTQRNSVRGLIVPLMICSALLLMLSYAAWTVLPGSSSLLGSVGSELEQEAGRLLENPVLETGGPGSILFFWFLPVSAVTLGTVMFRRSRDRRDDEVRR